MKHLKITGFDSIHKLTHALNSALRHGKAISFHNNNGVYVRNSQKDFDCVMIGCYGPNSFLESPNEEAEPTYLYISPCSFVPYIPDFFRGNEREKRIEIGGLIRIMGRDFILGSFGEVSSQIDSREYGPVIGTLRHHEQQFNNPKFVLNDEERYYWRR